MPIDVIVDSLDSVEESERPFFEKTDDGKFRLDFAKRDDFVKKPLLEKTSQLKREKEKLKALEKFSSLSEDDWAKYQEWKEAQGDGEEDPDDKGKKGDPTDFKKLIKAELKKAEEKYTGLLTEKEKALDAERLKFDNYRFDQELTGEALESGVIGGRIKKFKAAAIAEGIFGYREGKLVVLDEDGEPTSENPADRLKKMATQDDWKFFFEAKEAGGGSGRQKDGGKPGAKELKRSKMTAKEKSDFIKEHGNAAFLKLPL
jgi:hypothetical protein